MRSFSLFVVFAVLAALGAVVQAQSTFDCPCFDDNMDFTDSYTNSCVGPRSGDYTIQSIKWQMVDSSTFIYNSYSVQVTCDGVNVGDLYNGRGNDSNTVSVGTKCSNYGAEVFCRNSVLDCSPLELRVDSSVYCTGTACSC